MLNRLYVEGQMM